MIRLENDFRNYIHRKNEIEMQVDDDFAVLYPTFLDNENWNIVDNLQNYRGVIIQIYFMMTSLSTVGFGDYYPVNDFERIVGSIILLNGVAVFSYIMMKLADMIINFNVLNGEQSDETEIETFFLHIKKFNMGFPLK